MKIVKAGYEILDDIDGEEILKKIELCGRVCYKSEDRITNDSAKRFVKSIIQRGHESVLEHVSITVRFIVDRGVSHELVRHRIASYSQESSRYCNYGVKGIEFISPPFFKEGGVAEYEWLSVMQEIENSYLFMLNEGYTPEQARSILPNSLKTDVVTTMNLRSWRHFFKLRTSRQAHPQMREVAIPLLEEFKKLVPVVFDDIKVKVNNFI